MCPGSAPLLPRWLLRLLLWLLQPPWLLQLLLWRLLRQLLWLHWLPRPLWRLPLPARHPAAPLPATPLLLRPAAQCLPDALLLPATMLLHPAALLPAALLPATPLLLRPAPA